MLSNNSEAMLETIYKSARTGMDSIDYIHSKITDTKIGEKLLNKKENYHSLAMKAGAKLTESDKLPQENNLLSKASIWSSIQAETLIDKSNANIASIMINGSKMGLQNIKNAMADYPDLSEDTQAICDEFIKEEEDNIKQMKQFL